MEKLMVMIFMVSKQQWTANLPNIWVTHFRANPLYYQKRNNKRFKEPFSNIYVMLSRKTNSHLELLETLLHKRGYYLLSNPSRNIYCLILKFVKLCKKSCFNSTLGVCISKGKKCKNY